MTALGFDVWPDTPLVTKGAVALADLCPTAPVVFGARTLGDMSALFVQFTRRRSSSGRSAMFGKRICFRQDTSSLPAEVERTYRVSDQKRL